MLTGQNVFPLLSPLCSLPRYTFFAEYLHVFSAGHDKQFVALPAALGFRVLLKYCRPPNELTVVGICAGLADPGGGEQRSQRRRSMSWQDFVRREGAVVDSLRQFPLALIRLDWLKAAGRHT